VLLQRRLNPSLGRPDRTDSMKKMNEQEDQIHTETLNTLDCLRTKAYKAQQAILSEYIQNLCETTKSLLLLVDKVTLTHEIKDDPGLPKPRPKMKDLITKNVTANVSEAAKANVAIESSAEPKNQDVVLMKGPDGGLTIQTPKTLKLSAGAQRVSGETQIPASKMRRKSIDHKSQLSGDKLVEWSSAPLSTFKNNQYFWNQLPHDTIATLLSSFSRPKLLTPSTMSSADKKRIGLTPTPDVISESSWSTVLETVKEPLKTKKATEIHEIIVTRRNKEFEVNDCC